MNISKFFKVFKPIGSHKQVVKLIEIKHTLSIVIVVLFILFEIGAFAFLGNKLLNLNVNLEDKFNKNIAILNIDEQITSQYIQRLIQRVEEVRENKENFPELLVVMNCPGGSATASEEMRRYLDDLQKEGVKVTMYVESMAASGGYYIASSAKYSDKEPLSGIIANQNALVGSIGVIIAYPLVEELSKKLGVKEKVITIGKYKHPISMFKESTTEEEKYIKEQFMMPIYRNFLSMVAQGRNMSVEEMQKYADGKVFVASEVKGPLVDRVSYLHAIKKEIKQRVQKQYKESDVGFVTINTAKKRASLLDTKLELSLDLAKNLSQGELSFK